MAPSKLSSKSGSDDPTKNNYTIYLVVILSVLITIGAWQYVSNTVGRQARQQFDKELSDVTKTIQNTIEEYVNASYGIKGLFAASEVVDRNEFSAYITELGLRERYPGLVTIYYAEKISSEDQEIFVEEIRNEGYSSFEIHPPIVGDEAFIVNFIEPFNLYKSAHGFNIASEASRGKAMVRARDSGEPTITDKVTLLNAEQSDRAFIVYFPVYNNTMPTYTVKERQAAIKGYVGAIFNGTSFFQAVIGDTLGNERISLNIFDEETANEEDLFYTNMPSIEKISEGKFDFNDTITIPVIGSAWTLKFAAQKNFILPVTQQLFPTIVLVAGIIFTGLLFISLYILSTGKARALAIVDSMTADLRIYADIVKNMAEGLLIFKHTSHEDKPAFTLSLANPISEAELQSEVTTPLIVGKQLYELFPHLEEKNMIDQFLEVLSSKQTFEYEDTRNTKLGPRTFLSKAFAMPNDSIGITYVDITEQKEIQNTLREHSDELQKLNKFMVDREVKMVELKKDLVSCKEVTSKTDNG